VPVGAVDEEYLARLASVVMAEWRPADLVADLLLSLTDDQSAALLAWSCAGLPELIDLQDAIHGDTSHAAQRLRALGSAIGFWHEPRVTPCVRMLTRDPSWQSAQLLFAKMLREGPDWTGRVVTGVLKPRSNDIRGVFGALVSAVRHFDLPLPASDRFVVAWAETFADLPVERWVWTVADGTVTAETVRDTEALFASTPHLEQLVCRAVGLPNALQAVHMCEELPNTALSAAVMRAVACGTVARQPVLDAVFDALDSTGYAPAAQRVLSNLLRGLDLTKDDVAANLPRMVSLLGIASSMAATMLWEHLAGLDLEPEDLLEVGTVLLSRQEIKMWEAVVGYVVRLPQTSPLISTAVELCTQAALLDDRAVAARARTFVEQHVPAELIPVTDETVEAQTWDLPPLVPWRGPWGPVLGLDETRETRAVGLGERFRYDYEGVALPGVADEWKDRPSGGTLLCLPTHSDWTVTFDDLLARIRAAQDEGYWPHDLAQALLRLEPTDPSRAVELDGLTLPAARDMDASSPLRTGGGRYIAEWIKKQSGGNLPDGVELIRTWVVAGGMTIPQATFDELGDTVLPDLRFPVLVPGVRAMRKLTGNGDVWPGGLAAMPLAVEYHCSCGRATHVPTRYGKTSHWRWGDDRVPGATRHHVGGIAQAHGPFGRATYGYLAMNFAPAGAADDEGDSTPQDDVLALILQGRFDPEAFVEALRYLNTLPSDVKSGFSLARFAARCDVLAQGGALHGIWPVLTAMAVTAVTSPKIPTGTLDLLRVANRYAATVAGHLPPDEVVPPQVRVFAASKSKTKAALEARAWLDTATVAGVTFSEPAPVAVAPPPAVSAAQFDKVWPHGAGTLPAVVDGATLTVEWRDPSVQVKALRFDLTLPGRPDEGFVVVRSVTRGNEWTYDLEQEGQCWAARHRVGEPATTFNTWLHWDADTGRLVTTRDRNWVDGNDDPLPRKKAPVLSTTLVAVVLGLVAQDHDRDRCDGEELVASLVEREKIGSAVVRVAVSQLLEHPVVDPARLVRQLANKPALLPILWPLFTEPVRVAGATDSPPPRWLSRVLDAAIAHAPTLREAAARGLIPGDAARWPGLADIAARPGKSAASTKARTLLAALGLEP